VPSVMGVMDGYWSDGQAAQSKTRQLSLLSCVVFH